MRKSPAKVTTAIEKLLREQARIRVPLLSVKEIAQRTGLHRNSVYNYLERFIADEVHKSNSHSAERESHSHP